MTAKKNLIFLLVIVVGITITTLGKTTVPKNIFEELYEVELHKADKQENVVLSGTEYFKVEKAIVKRQESGSFILKETPVLQSPYSLQIGKNVDGGGLHRQESKNVVIGISYVFQTINFSVQYRYLFDGGGGDPVVSGEGLHIEWKASKNNDELSSRDLLLKEKNYEETLQKWGVTVPEIESETKKELQLFFEMWLNAYPKSRFSKHDLGEYEEVK